MSFSIRTFLGFFSLLILAVAAQPPPSEDEGIYQIGVGIADATGPAAEVNMMGYARIDQLSSGIHTRQWSRAFIIADDSKRIVFVNLDAGMTSQIVRIEAIRRLKEKYGDLYNEENVCISSIHTHSGPAGFFQYLLYDITSLGFVRETFEALVSGIVKSIDRAHQNLQQGRIYYNLGDLLNASINRSPLSYQQNPEKERSQYKYDVDKEMFLLKFTDLEDKPIGMINWFPVHGVSMNNSNKLISSDNKGYASLLFENLMEPESLPGKSQFVAAFAQANEGDVTPNINGPRCVNSGLPCDRQTSTCGGKSELCIAFGPGKDMFESTQIIAQRQFDKAKELFDAASMRIVGPINYVHRTVDMSEVELEINGKNVKLCKPAVGHSFAAGTIDGAGAFDFKQHTVLGQENTFWNLVRNIVKLPSKELTDCQAPKPILLATGELNKPVPWQQTIVNIQILQIGQLAILAVPGEFTTMSGRRLRNAVQQMLSPDSEIVIAGLSNDYTNYVTTFEEYQFQRYEGASTIYGPHTLEAYIHLYSDLAQYLKTGSPVEKGPEPPNYLNSQLTLMTPIIMDTAPIFSKFGDPIVDASPVYSRGSSVVVKFVCGHPRNNLMLEGTFLSVERLIPNPNPGVNETAEEWLVVATDANWETKFIWRRTNNILRQSECTVQWDIPRNAVQGTYRIRHLGYRKRILSDPTPYEGQTSNFEIH